MLLDIPPVGNLLCLEVLQSQPGFALEGSTDSSRNKMSVLGLLYRAFLYQIFITRPTSLDQNQQRLHLQQPYYTMYT